MTLLALAQPASAQFFFKSHDMTGPAVTGTEGEFSTAFPKATADEVRAALVWRVRSALNVAALQCQFEPTLMSVQNYNAVLFNHEAEFKKNYAVLGKYFVRVSKTPRIGQDALDRFGTRTYSSYTAVNAQRGFCQTASKIAERAAYAPRGTFVDIALDQFRTLNNSLVYWSEERFPGRPRMASVAYVPNLDPRCWDRRGWLAKKCGAFYGPLASN
ncbi:hypothetical protein [Sphingomonas immobilis]|uniref:Uncharacterized protein n=1 Tax=Sphingomonas immobilis TaxID=3063997 RepID=A0ABT9A1H4_9SPHN|nr:hypothetical protein [Sphingomonas sp. CA1-15]MDO7842572.1 hypothetical protein [Sphingomonas sp. CA1-15]